MSKSTSTLAVSLSSAQIAGKTVTPRQVRNLSTSSTSFQNTFRRKGTGPFQDLALSSVENPFGKGSHVSGYTSLTGTRKKPTPTYYNKYAQNPMSQSTVVMASHRTKLPPSIASETKALNDRRYVLPSDRRVKPHVKHYHQSHSGYLTQHEQHACNPQRLQYKSTTSNLKSLLSYGYAKHKPWNVTGKITDIHLHK